MLILENEYKNGVLIKTNKVEEKTLKKNVSKLLLGIWNTPKEGEHIIYYDSGEVFAKENYENGKKNGKCEYFHENGNYIYVVNFLQGYREGNYYKYNKDNEIIERKTFKDDKEVEYKEEKELQDDTKNGLLTLYYSATDRKEKYIEVNLKNGEYDGEYKCWWPNGQIKAECIYKEGKLEGNSKEYNQEGVLIKESFWKNNLKEGLEKVYE